MLTANLKPFTLNSKPLTLYPFLLTSSRLLRGRIVNMDASTKDTESYARLTGV